MGKQFTHTSKRSSTVINFIAAFWYLIHIRESNNSRKQAFNDIRTDLRKGYQKNGWRGIQTAFSSVLFDAEFQVNLAWANWLGRYRARKSTNQKRVSDNSNSVDEECDRNDDIKLPPQSPHVSGWGSLFIRLFKTSFTCLILAILDNEIFWEITGKISDLGGAIVSILAFFVIVHGCVPPELTGSLRRGKLRVWMTICTSD